MSAELRAAVVEDATGVADVLLSSRRTFLSYAPLAHTDAEVRQWVSEALVPSGGVTVACMGGTVIGFLAATHESSVTWVNQFYIAPGHTGHGIGSGLLTLALASLAFPVRLYTFQANTRARSFYEHHGFKAVAFSDGSANEERCPDVLYELAAPIKPGA